MLDSELNAFTIKNITETFGQTYHIHVLILVDGDYVAEGAY